MNEQHSFQQLITAVRKGDDVAAESLIRQYEPELRIMARVRLTDPTLRRAMDSMDICQSIMANFFVRAASGDFEIDTPEQLKGLLVRMLKNKVVDHARRQKADRRDARRVVGKPAEEIPLDGSDPTPSAIIAGRELLEEFQRRLTDDERFLVEQRQAGVPWSEIAQQAGGTPEQLRKRHARAMQRIAEEIGLEPGGDE